MDKENIRKIALDRGFKLKQQPDSSVDLNPYVYDFAAELEAQAIERFCEELKEKNCLSKEVHEIAIERARSFRLSIGQHSLGETNKNDKQ